METLYSRKSSSQLDALGTPQEVEVSLRASGSSVNLRTLGSSSSSLKSSADSRASKYIPAAPTVSYGHVGGRISGTGRTSTMDWLLLGAGTLLLAVGVLCIMSAGRLTLECDMARDLAGRQADLCRITQQFGWIAPSTFWLSHSRTVPLRSIERPVVLMQAAEEELAFQRVDGADGHQLQRLAGAEYRDMYDQYHDDIDVEDEDVLRQHKCLLGLRVVHDDGEAEHVVCSLVQKWCLGPEMDTGMHSIEEFLKKRNLAEEDLEVAADGADRAVTRLRLEDHTKPLPQAIGIVLFVLGVALLVIYQVGGIRFLCSVVPQ